ncbi:MAG: hypothetical protein QM760_20615 [Nibricoccus sp.]
MRCLLVLALAFGTCVLHADSPALTVTQQLLPSPAPVGATTPFFIETPDGPRLAWKETSSAGQVQYVGATWDHASSRWSSPAVLPIDAPAIPTVATVRFPDGSDLSAFFPEKDGRILDLHTQRLHGQISTDPRPLSSDSWRNAPYALHPTESPLLRAREARVVAIWLNFAEASPRLFAALSTTAGEQFFMPVRIDDGHPLGRASIALLMDGSAYISWLESYGAENAAALWLRRLSPAGDLSVPVLITTAPTAAALGHPQITLLKDYDSAPAQLLVAHELTNEGVTQIVTRLIVLPPAESFIQGRPCLACPPDTATLPGHPLMGRVVKLTPRKQLVAIEHSEIPGILRAGKTTFHANEQTLTALRETDSIIARIEQRDGIWWLFDVRRLATQTRH